MADGFRLTWPISLPICRESSCSSGGRITSYRPQSSKEDIHMHEVTESGIPISAEDKFLIFSFGRARSLSPGTNHADHLGEMLLGLPNTIVPIFDLRGIEDYYNDIDQFVRSVGGDNANVLLGSREVELGWETRLIRQGLSPIKTKGQLINQSAVLELSIFDCDAEDYFKFTEDEYVRKHRYIEHADLAYQAQLDDLHDLLQSIHTHSLMIEYVIATRSDHVTITPYHANAIHEVETKAGSVITARPAVIAESTGAIFTDELVELERLINDSDTKERHLQKFLEVHPHFLTGLNYQNIYPQLVLERDGDGPLKPDFFLEPFDDSFCDILDLKLPTQKLIIGRKDRLDLAAGLHEVAAQLREYAAYFEQEKYRRMVKEKYGLRVYRPRLIALVGRDMKQMVEPQLRRAMTQYDNLQFMTFDELVRHAKKRILI